MKNETILFLSIFIMGLIGYYTCILELLIINHKKIKNIRYCFPLGIKFDTKEEKLNDKQN